ncbi:hypothetical protein A9Q95_14350 [Rhodobacterales bacterium 59_46_T64]|nr:hypothetical protein A9Q95_14350 [Rhodobacterales bacterium 59_46_T64]
MGGIVAPLYRRTGQIKHLHQSGEKLWLQRGQRYPFAVATFINAVKGCAAVKPVGRTGVFPSAIGEKSVDESHHRCGPVDNGRIDHIAFVGPSGAQQGRDHAKGQEHPTGSELAQ